MSAKPTVGIAHSWHVPETPLCYTRKARDRIIAMIDEAVGRVSNLERLVRNKTVLIKPNLVRPNLKNSHHVITDPRVVDALVRLLLDCRPKQVLVGENPGYGMSSRYAFRSSTLARRLAKLDVGFSYFDEEPPVLVPNRGAVLFRDVMVPRSVMDADVFIDLPKLKTHMQTLISVGVKNLHGITYDEQRLDFHRGDVEQKIVDIYRIRKPTLTVVDGIWATEGQAPLFGDVIKDMNVIVAGRDTVAVDSVCARLMGIHPEEVGVLRLARFDGLGEIDPAKVRVVGVPVEKVWRPFRRPILGSTGAYPGVRVVEGGACSGCLSSLRHSLDRMADAGAIGPKAPMSVWIGCPKGDDEVLTSVGKGEEVWLFGDCLCRAVDALGQSNGRIHFVPGCPPHVLDFARDYAEAHGIKAARVPRPRIGRKRKRREADDSKTKPAASS